MGSTNVLAAILALAVAGSLALAGGAAAFSPATVYRDAAPSVVVIFGFDRKGRGATGSGTLITASGQVLTNAHVVVDPNTGRAYEHVQVYFRPRQLTGIQRKDLVHPHDARVTARDEVLDLALLQLDGAPPTALPISIGDSEAVEIGEPVAAIGHPGGGGLWTLTTGTISSMRRDGARDVFQTDAAINPGNSGGPLLDEHARLIGINTFVRRVNQQGLPLEGLNYSLRSASVLDWLGRHGVALAITKPPDPRAPTHALADPGAQTPADPSGRSTTAAAPPHASTPAPTPSPNPAPPPAPAPSPDRGAAPLAQAPAPGSPEKDLCEFEGERGEPMYGIPNRAFRPESALRDVQRQTLRNAGEAFSELDGLSMEEF